MADRRLRAGMSIGPVVGKTTEDEFDSYQLMLEHLPNIDAIASGKGMRIPFPEEPSVKFATMAELTRRSLASFDAFVHCFEWAVAKNEDEPDWNSGFAQDYIRLMRTNKPSEFRRIAPKMIELPAISRFVREQSAAGGML